MPQPKHTEEVEAPADWWAEVRAALQIILGRAKGTMLQIEGTELMPEWQCRIIYGDVPPHIAAPLILMDGLRAQADRISYGRLQRLGIAAFNS